MNPGEVAAHIAARQGMVPRRLGPNDYMVPCPAHADEKPSLHVCAGRTQPVVLCCAAGCATGDVLAAGNLSWRDLCNRATLSSIWSRITAEYRYRDEAGRYLFTVARAGDGRGKQFVCYSFDESGEQISEVRDLRRVLYRLPELIAARCTEEPIYLCEGEKDADAMHAAYGVCATTNPFGAAAWPRDCAGHGYAEYLRGATVVIVEHNDVGGRQRSRRILTSLRDIAASLRIVQAAVGNDAFDHIAAGLDLAAFVPAEIAVRSDDESFAALPHAFFDAVNTVNLTYLERCVLIEVARQTVWREDGQPLWRSRQLSSSWLAKTLGGASPSAVRAVIGRLRAAGIVLSEGSIPGQASLLSINGDVAAWRSLARKPRR